MGYPENDQTRTVNGKSEAFQKRPFAHYPLFHRPVIEEFDFPGYPEHGTDHPLMMIETNLSLPVSFQLPVKILCIAGLK